MPPSCWRLAVTIAASGFATSASAFPPPSAPGLLGAEAYLGTLLVAAPHLDVERLAAAVDDELAILEEASGGAGTLPSDCGVGVRVIAERPAAARRALDAAWALARRELLGAPLPPRRK